MEFNSPEIIDTSYGIQFSGTKGNKEAWEILEKMISS